MDLATLIGLAGATLLIASAVILGVSPAVFINPASLLIVVGGTMFVVLARDRRHAGAGEPRGDPAGSRRGPQFPVPTG